MEKLPARSGICLGPAYLKELVEIRPDIGWLELKPEYFLGRSGTPHFYLQDLAIDYPLSLHAQGFSIASAESPSHSYLSKVKALDQQYRFRQVSTPLAWCRWQGRYLAEPLPFPLSLEALDQVALNVKHIQNTLGRRILIENTAGYLPLQDSDYTEAEFLTELIRHTGCGLLMDVNNLYIQALNLNKDPAKHLQDYPIAAIQELHLSGHQFKALDEQEMLLLPNTQSEPQKPVLQLYREVLTLLPKPIATLIEWDERQPSLDVLMQQVRHLDALINTAFIKNERLSV